MSNHSNVFWAILTLVALIAELVGLPAGHPWKVPLVTVTILIFIAIVGLTIWDRVVPLWRKRLFHSAEELGIREIHTRGHGSERQIHMMASARDSIRIMAVSAHTLLFMRKSEIVTALANGANLRLLIARPYSQFVLDVERVESPARAGEISLEIASVKKLLSEYLADAVKKAAGAVGTVTLAHYSTDLRCSMVLCGNNWGWLTINLPPCRAVETCSFELEGVPEGLLADAQKHFEQVWNLAVDEDRVENIAPQPAA